MPYQVIRSGTARQDIRRYFRYLKREAGEDIMRSYMVALEHDIRVVIANHPHAFGWFDAGAPYRAKLFKLARTTFWIIYTVDDDRQCVEIRRFWNAAQQPTTHGL